MLSLLFAGRDVLPTLLSFLDNKTIISAHNRFNSQSCNFVLSTYQLSACQIVEPLQELNASGLATPGLSHQGNVLAPAQAQIHLGQDLDVGTGRIRKVRGFEHHLARNGGLEQSKGEDHVNSGKYVKKKRDPLSKINCQLRNCFPRQRFLLIADYLVQQNIGAQRGYVNK